MAALDSVRRPRPQHRKRETLTRRISFPTFHLSPDQLALVRRWIISFALVDFDVDTGPNLDNAYPPARLPAATRANVAFSSMPEAVGLPHPEQLPDGGYAYHWRVPYPGEDDLARLDPEAVDEGDEDEDEARLLRLPEGEGADGALHGFVWFVRDKDERLRRGYSQRSLVLISHLPALSGLFSALVSILGPLHFKHAQPGGARGGMVETACHNIASWPDPTPGATLELPFLGSVLTVSLPLPSQAQFPLPAPSSSAGSSPSSAPLRRTPSSAPIAPPTPAAWHLSRGAAHLPLVTGPPAILPASLPSTPLCVLLFPPASPTSTSGSSSSTSLGEIGPVGYSKLLLLWELVALGEPLLVWAAEPRVGAEVVEALKALIKPIPFAGDVRPYFHVHDADFTTLCKAGKKPPQGLLVASTNPLLLSTCKHWPHVLRLDRAAPASSSASPSSSPTLTLPASASSSSTSVIAPLRPRSASNGNGHTLGGGEDGSASGGAGKEFGLRSSSKRHVKKDEAVEKEIAELWKRGEYLACDAVIYRHFAALTERFLAPLNRYFGTLWAGNEAVAARAPLVSPGPSPLPSTRFSRSAFLASLRTHGSPLPLKSGAPSLSQPGSTATERFYSRFVDGANFERWAEKRVRDTGGEVRRRFVRTLESEDWEVWARGREVAEVDDMVRRLEREVVLLDPAPSTSSSSVAGPRTSVSTTASSTLPSSSSAPSSRTNSPAPSSTTSQTHSQTPTPATVGSAALNGDGPSAKLRAGVRLLQGLRDEKRRERNASVGSSARGSSAGCLERMLSAFLSTCAPFLSRLRSSPSHDDLIAAPPPRASTKPGMGAAAAAQGADSKDCIFCGVTAASPGFRVVHEDGEFVVFKDRSPGSKVHLLAVPKRHVASVKTLEVEDVGMLERMKYLGRRVLVEQGVPEGGQRLGFHIPPFFSVNHLHLHLLSLPLPFPGSIKYRPSHPSSTSSKRIKGLSWFVDIDQVIDILRAGQRVHVRPVKRGPSSSASAVA
ncbi:hypothetical protein JCM9279_006124 [Rhodotorula babjevae]